MNTQAHSEATPCLRDMLTQLTKSFTAGVLPSHSHFHDNNAYQ
jgi:hypothetical protein